MKKFLLGMMFAHYLSLIGRSEFFRAVVLGVTKNLKKLEEETRPESSIGEQRTAASESKVKINQAAVNRIIDLSEGGESVEEISYLTGLPQSSILHIINKA